MKYETTLNSIHKHRPCERGWATLLEYLGKTLPDDETLSLATILDSNGLADAVWCLRTVPGTSRDARLFAVRCARMVKHKMGAPHVFNLLDVAERYAHGTATATELDIARDAAKRSTPSCGHAKAAATATAMGHAHEAACQVLMAVERCLNDAVNVSGHMHTDGEEVGHAIGDRVYIMNRQIKVFRDMFCGGKAATSASPTSERRPMQYETTLKKIRDKRPCHMGWTKLLKYLGKKCSDDEPVSLSDVLDSNGLSDAVWCLSACDNIDRDARLFAVWCARQVKYPEGSKLMLAAMDTINAAERYALGAATSDELRAVRRAAESIASTLDRAEEATVFEVDAFDVAVATTLVDASFAARRAYLCAGIAVSDGGVCPPDVDSSQRDKFQQLFCQPLKVAAEPTPDRDTVVDPGSHRVELILSDVDRTIVAEACGLYQLRENVSDTGSNQDGAVLSAICRDWMQRLSRGKVRASVYRQVGKTGMLQASLREKSVASLREIADLLEAQPSQDEPATSQQSVSDSVEWEQWRKAGELCGRIQNGMKFGYVTLCRNRSADRCFIVKWRFNAANAQYSSEHMLDPLELDRIDVELLADWCINKFCKEYYDEFIAGTLTKPADTATS
jgi:hypothetical protein